MQGSSGSAAGVQQRLACLRHDLLGGRGPGATTAEVSRHTRDRRQLGGVRTPAELESVHQQTQRERVGDPARGRRPAPADATAFRPIVLGAVAALVVSSILSARARRRRRTRGG
ncbi:hypothetical protein [Jatrophihabitans lederbergiae]|uniref:DUF1707 domain-containing protein n=1 Tax=Jatrophihabitans lederbergiae TaxID=3075547 RepID=A0ABU2JHN9_9ACTN|nr:hypothetical protein [Jatrophihabitans sp. DSM 44399]MDT0264427.1 hypothetical protein [Jatrophihabitans sp. DSM 44399]